MNLQEKNVYAESHIRSISRHIDVDAAVRKAKLGQLKAFIDAELEWIDAQIQDQIEALEAS